MKERIAIGKFHHGPNRYDQNMRIETLILLHQTWVLQESPCSCQRVRRIAHWREPDDRTCCFRCFVALPPILQFYSPSQCHFVDTDHATAQNNHPYPSATFQRPCPEVERSLCHAIRRECPSSGLSDRRFDYHYQSQMFSGGDIPPRRASLSVDDR